MTAVDSAVSTPVEDAGRRPWMPSPLAGAVLCAGIGLVLCALANALSRETNGYPELLYWLGVLAITLPIVFRLCLEAPSTGERIALVVTLAAALYVVKVIRDPFLFTFPDEPIHAYNADQIVATHHLFNSNSILPITAYFPGLGSATSALMALTGMSEYVSGTILVGVARITFALGLFLLFRRVSGSGRFAGIAVAVYAANSNFLSYGSQYGYESLALPLLAVVLASLVEREGEWPSSSLAWAVPIVLGIAAIAVTHHLTSYALVVLLVVLAIVGRLAFPSRPNAWPFAAAAAAAALVWLVVVASSTIDYLSPVLLEAFKDAIRTASGEAAPRTLFHSSTSSVEGATPLIARVVSLGAVALLLVGFLAGFRRIWRERPGEPMTVLFGIGAIAFFGALALRFAPAAWETGNRAGEFFFIGLAFVVTTGAFIALRPGDRLRTRRLLLVAAIGIAVVGGAISGWPWDSQLARPLRIEAEGRTISSEPLKLADWAAANPPDGALAATRADARLLLSVGNAEPESDTSDGIERILEAPKLESWMLPKLDDVDANYVVTDNRIVSNDNVRGYFFFEPGTDADRLLPPESAAKFERLGIGRVFDSGHIVVFDLRNRR